MAAKIKLKNEAALKRLASSPDDKYTVVTNNAGIDTKKLDAQRKQMSTQMADDRVTRQIQNDRKKRGFVGNLVYDTGKSLTAAPRTLVAHLASDKVDKKILDKDEYRRFKKDPTAFSLQSMANTGSFLVPGFGIASAPTRMAAQGLIGGALQGFGNQDLRKGFNAGEVLKGAATGAVLSGGMGLAGKTLSKAKANAGRSVTRNAARNMPSMGNMSDDQIDNLIDLMIDSSPSKVNPKTGLPMLDGNAAQRAGKRLQLNDIGFKFDAKQGGRAYEEFFKSGSKLDRARKAIGANLDAEGVQRTLNAMNTARSRLVQNSGFKGALDNELVERAVANLKTQAGNLSDDEARALVANYIDDVSNKLGGVKAVKGNKLFGGEDLERLRSEYTSSAARKTRGAIERGSQPQNSALVNMALDDAAKDVLFKNIPGYSQFNQTYAPILQRSQNMTSALNAGNQVSNQGRMMAPTELVMRKGQQVLGKGLEKVGNFAENIRNPSNIANSISNRGAQSPMVQALAGTRLAKYVTPLLESSAGGAAVRGGLNTAPDTSEYIPDRQAFAEQYANQYSPAFLPQEQYEQMPETEAPQIPTRMDVLNQALQMTNGDMKQALTLANYLSADLEAQQKAANVVPEEMTQTQMRGDFGMRGVQELRSLLSNKGVNSLAFGNRLPGFLKSNDSRSYANLRDQIAEAFGRIQSGGAINKGEEQRFYRFVPSEFDDAETVERKLNELEVFFANARGLPAQAEPMNQQSMAYEM